MAKDTGSHILESVDKKSRGLVLRLKKLQEIGVVLSQEHDLVKLLHIILKESRSLTDADAGAVFVRDDEVKTDPNATGKDRIHIVTPWLAIKTAQNDSIAFPFKEMRLPFDEKTISGHVALSGEVLNIEDVYTLPETATYTYNTDFDKKSGYRCRSMLVMPMRNREGDIIGVIQLINKKKDPAAKLDTEAAVMEKSCTFTPVDEELVSSLASQAAVCIEKAKLYDEIGKMFEGLVSSFTHALEKRNKTTFGHCTRVAGYAVALAEAINDAPESEFGGVRFSPIELQELKYAALLHDIGKIAVPEAVLDKRNKLLDSEMDAILGRLQLAKLQGAPAEKVDGWIEAVTRINIPRGLRDGDRELLDEIKAATYRDASGKAQPLLTDHEHENLAIPRGNLTPGERKQIEQHIVDTWEMLKRIPWPRDFRRVANIAACHHEKLNGSGYPWKLRGDEIPLGGQILALVDIYEALTAKDRPYKPAMPVEKALSICKQEVEGGKLNAKIFDLFVEKEIYTLYSKGTGFITPPKETPAHA